MKSLKTEVAVIGAGTAGMAAYRRVVAHGRSALLIEGGPYGTTCARVGCMPSKLLIAAADAAHQVRQAALFGVFADAPRIDGAAVMRRVRAERDRFVDFVQQAVRSWPAEQRLQGNASFVAPGRLVVDERVLVEAERIVIATGSSPSVPEEWRAALGDRLVVTDDVFEWTTLPASLAVVGAGAIGLELAQALARLGVRVRLFGRGARVAALSDPAVNAEALKLIAEEVPYEPDAQIHAVARAGDGVEVDYQAGERRLRERFDLLLAATGRRPNLAGLRLERSGLTLNAKGVPLFDVETGQAGEQPVFIAGDVTHERPLLHEAADAGRLAGDNASRFPELRERQRKVPLAIVFTDPQIALVGEPYAELRERGAHFEAGEVSFDDQGRSRVTARNRGLLRVYGEHGTGRFLGAEMIAPAGEHLAHLLAWAAQQQMTVQAMLDCPYYHPVIEEGIRTALRVLNRRLRRGPAPIEHCLDCGPGG